VLAEDTRRPPSCFGATASYAARIRARAQRSGAGGAGRGWLDAARDLALVSDAGTPLVSDPGARIVSAVVEAGHEVVPIPGASALLAALVASGMDPEPFTFYGFAPRSGRARGRLLEDLRS
jgi:16S rRNA C1402 (ribose-2'-O) methylase RsmI